MGYPFYSTAVRPACNDITGRFPWMWLSCAVSLLPAVFFGLGRPLRGLAGLCLPGKTRPALKIRTAPFALGHYSQQGRRGSQMHGRP